DRGPRVRRLSRARLRARAARGHAAAERQGRRVLLRRRHAARHRRRAAELHLRQLHPCAGLRARPRRNVVAQLVAKRVRGGETRLSLSCNPDLTLDLLACRARKECDFLFVGQVNSELPFMPGDGDIAASEFDLLLESAATDFRLFAPPREPVELADYAAGM